MNLNTIQLHPSTIANLYEKTLVETIGSAPEETSAETIPARSKQELKFLGSNRKNIVVLLSYSGLTFLPDHDLNFLSSVLAACKLSTADIAIVNIRDLGEEEIQSFIREHAQYVLLFGIEPQAIGLPVHFPQFQLQVLSKQTYMHAPSLPGIEKDKEMKKSLWTSLKKLFGIS